MKADSWVEKGPYCLNPSIRGLVEVRFLLPFPAFNDMPYPVKDLFVLFSFYYCYQISERFKLFLCKHFAAGLLEINVRSLILYSYLSPHVFGENCQKLKLFMTSTLTPETHNLKVGWIQKEREKACLFFNTGFLEWHIWMKCS